MVLLSFNTLITCLMIKPDEIPEDWCNHFKFELSFKTYLIAMLGEKPVVNAASHKSLQQSLSWACNMGRFVPVTTQPNRQWQPSGLFSAKNLTCDCLLMFGRLLREAVRKWTTLQILLWPLYSKDNAIKLLAQCRMWLVFLTCCELANKKLLL